MAEPPAPSLLPPSGGGAASPRPRPAARPTRTLRRRRRVSTRLLNLAPAGPLYGSDADDPPFLSEEWWRLLDGVCEDADELGVSLWFYDQLGFSGADIQARSGGRTPGVRRASVATGRVWSTATAARTETVRGRMARDGRPSRPTPTGRPDDRPTARRPVDRTATAYAGGSVRAPGPGRWRLTLLHEMDHGFDYLGAGACAALLDRVHGEFERRLGDRLGQGRGRLVPGRTARRCPPGRPGSPPLPAPCGYDLRDTPRRPVGRAHPDSESRPARLSRTPR